jgi:hypothetical protein
MKPGGHGVLAGLAEKHLLALLSFPFPIARGRELAALKTARLSLGGLGNHLGRGLERVSDKRAFLVRAIKRNGPDPVKTRPGPFKTNRFGN